MLFCSRVLELPVSLYWNRNLKGARARFQGRVSKPSFSGGGAWCVWMVGRRQRRLSSMHRLESSRMCHQSWAGWSVSGFVDKRVEFRVYSFDPKQTSGGLKQGSGVM